MHAPTRGPVGQARPVAPASRCGPFYARSWHPRMPAAWLLSADRQAASVALGVGVACKKQGPVMVKAAIAALIVLLTFLAVVKLTGLAPLAI
jgi:hypothetical protein